MLFQTNSGLPTILNFYQQKCFPKRMHYITQSYKKCMSWAIFIQFQFYVKIRIFSRSIWYTSSWNNVFRWSIKNTFWKPSVRILKNIWKKLICWNDMNNRMIFSNWITIYSTSTKNLFTSCPTTYESDQNYCVP